MTVYVTGGTGFVGSNIVKLYSEVHGLDVVSAGRSAPPKSLPGRFVGVDLLDPAAVRASILREQPEFVVHAAILNDFDLMHRDRRLAWDSYVETTRSIVDAANEIDATVVYVSTDWVFDGTQPGADEATPPNPINLYGFLKAAAELVVLERARNPIVARIAGVNGIHWARPETPRQQDAGFGFFVASLVDALEAGRTFEVWESPDINCRATPSLASESAEMMLRLVRAGARGTFHCCGGESLTRMQLALLATEVFDLDPRLVLSGPPDPAVMGATAIPYDTSLTAPATAAAIGYTLPSARQLLEELKHQRATGIVRPVGGR